jgi:predicted PP-loop superfamily ATPase
VGKRWRWREKPARKEREKKEKHQFTRAQFFFLGGYLKKKRVVGEEESKRGKPDEVRMGLEVGGGVDAYDAVGSSPMSSLI